MSAVRADLEVVLEVPVQPVSAAVAVVDAVRVVPVAEAEAEAADPNSKSNEGRIR